MEKRIKYSYCVDENDQLVHIIDILEVGLVYLIKKDGQ